MFIQERLFLSIQITMICTSEKPKMRWNQVPRSALMVWPGNERLRIKKGDTIESVVSRFQQMIQHTERLWFKNAYDICAC